MILPPVSKSSSILSPITSSTGSRCCAISGRIFPARLTGIKDLRTTEVLDSLNELLGPHIFPAKEDGSNPRACPSCGNGQLSLKLGKFGAFIGCSNYPECKFTRTLADTKRGWRRQWRASRASRILGKDPATGDEISLRDGRFGAYVQQGEGEKPKRVSLPKNDRFQAELTLAQATRLAFAAARDRQTSRDKGTDPGRDRPLRSLCPAPQDLCEHRQGRRYSEHWRQSRDRPHRRQGKRLDRAAFRRLRERAFAGARAMHPSGRRGRGQGRAVRPLCQLRQNQRDIAARCRRHHVDA